MSEIMTASQYSVLCKVEEYFLRKDTLPTVDYLTKKTGLDRVQVVEALSSPLVKQSLDRRGIALFSDLEDALTPIQVATINLVLNVADTRSLRAKLQALGVKPSTYQGWKRQKNFVEALNRHGERLFGQSQAEVHTALTKAAMEGDINAIKYFNQVSGRYDSAKSVEAINIRFLMAKLIEVIQKHVKDPVVLSAIAEEIGGLMDGNNT